MSRVTTVIVSIGPEPAEVHEALNADLDGGPGLRQITHKSPATEAWGGTKYPQLDLWGGAFNYVDWHVLFAHLEAIPWTEPKDIQVLIGAEEGPKLGLYELRAGRLVPLNVEAALQQATMGVIEGIVEPDGSVTSIREGRGNLPQSGEDLSQLVDDVARTLAPAEPDALADEIRFLLLEDD